MENRKKTIHALLFVLFFSIVMNLRLLHKENKSKAYSRELAINLTNCSSMLIAYRNDYLHLVNELENNPERSCEYVQD
jgi:hypothetical protein